MNSNTQNEKILDSSLALMREGYLFISNKIRENNSKIFKARLMAQDVICMRGKEAAELLYDQDRFQRYNAAPKRVQKTLFGENAIQSLDGNEHLHRKNLFLSILTPENDRRLAELTLKQWQDSVSKWEGLEKIKLFEEAKNILCWVSCRWAGIPLQKADTEEKADDFYSMIDGFGGIGPRYWMGKHARNQTEQWIAQIIDDTRAGKLKPDENTALYSIAFYKEADGIQLDTSMAAIELINIIRPIIAIATYIMSTEQFTSPHK
jgi:fatty-acid peroxygenase